MHVQSANKPERNIHYYTLTYLTISRFVYVVYYHSLSASIYICTHMIKVSAYIHISTHIIDICAGYYELCPQPAKHVFDVL
jgi:hypothetical protein